MKINFSEMNFAQLAEMRAALDAEIASRRTEEINAAKRQIQELARSLGLSAEEILTLAADSGKKGRKMEPRYRHPTDANLTWSGMGRKPYWVSDFEAQGGKLEQLLIAK